MFAEDENIVDDRPIRFATDLSTTRQPPLRPPVSVPSPVEQFVGPPAATNAPPEYVNDNDNEQVTESTTNTDDYGLFR
jgi:hypothetical protein